MKTLTFIFLLSAGMFSAVQAQENAAKLPPLPEGELLKRAPEYSSWKITCRAGGSSPAKASNAGSESATGDFKEQFVIKTGNTIYEKSVSPSNQISEIWRDQGLNAFFSGLDKKPIINPNDIDEDIYHTNYKDSDFAGLNWVSEKTYVGLQSVKGQDCMVFKTEMSLLSNVALQDIALQRKQAETMRAFGADTSKLVILEDKPEVVMAWIDLKSRLPVAAKFGKEERFYQFGPAPNAKIVLPPELAAAEKAYRARRERPALKSRLNPSGGGGG